MSQISPKKTKISESSRKKTKISERNEEKEAGFVDKFSNLPLDIIHDILSVVPFKDAVKFSVLSRKWRTIWVSRPVLYFYEDFYGLNREAFLTYLEKSLDSREKYGYSFCEIREFSLNMRVEENSQSEILAKRCFDFACRNKVQMFNFRIQMPDYSQHLPLCDTSYLAATLDSLFIQNCEIKNCSFVFPALKSLCLDNVCIENGDFKDLIAGCPRIEELRIESCRKLFKIVVSNPSLKSFSLRYQIGGKVQIESTNLEYFSFSNIFTGKCKVEITSNTITAKRLYLHDVYYQKRSLMSLISKFPLLEELELDRCSSFRTLCVSHQNMTSFALKRCYGIKEITIDAPKLKSLEFSGGLTSFTGIKSSKELEFVKFYLKPRVVDNNIFGCCLTGDDEIDEYVLDDRWFIWLRNTLESFAHSNRLRLIYSVKEAILFPYELTEKLLPTIPDLKNLELELEFNSRHITSQQIVENFKRILPGLKTLSVTKGSFSRTVTELIELP